MPRALWWLLACSRTAAAVLMTTATRAATTSDWGAVPELLKRRAVSAVFVEDAASLIDVNWSTALEGAATLRRLVDAAAKLGGPTIAAGGGVTEENVAALLRASGVDEVHGSCREPVRSAMRHRPPQPVPMGGERRAEDKAAGARRLERGEVGQDHVDFEIAVQKVAAPRPKHRVHRQRHAPHTDS